MEHTPPFPPDCKSGGKGGGFEIPGSGAGGLQIRLDGGRTLGAVGMRAWGKGKVKEGLAPG